MHQTLYMQGMDDLRELARNRCLGHAARQAARAVTRSYNSELRSVDLTAGQFGLLVAIDAMPGAALAALAQATGADETTVVRGIKPLERQGLVERTGRLGRDGRGARLTPLGEKRFAIALMSWSSAYRRVVDALGGEAEADRVLRALGDLSQATTAARTEVES